MLNLLTVIAMLYGAVEIGFAMCDYLMDLGFSVLATTIVATIPTTLMLISIVNYIDTMCPDVENGIE